MVVFSKMISIGDKLLSSASKIVCMVFMSIRTLGLKINLWLILHPFSRMVIFLLYCILLSFMINFYNVVYAETFDQKWGTMPEFSGQSHDLNARNNLLTYLDPQFDGYMNANGEYIRGYSIISWPTFPYNICPESYYFDVCDTGNSFTKDFLKTLPYDEKALAISGYLQDKINNFSGTNLDLKDLSRTLLINDITKPFWTTEIVKQILGLNVAAINSNGLSFKQCDILAHINVYLFIFDFSRATVLSFEQLLSKEDFYHHLFLKQFHGILNNGNG